MMDRLSRGAKAGEACHGRMKQSLLMLYVGALTQRYQQMTRRKRCLRRRSRSHRPDGSFLCPSFLTQASRCADTKIQQESALAWFFSELRPTSTWEDKTNGCVNDLCRDLPAWRRKKAVVQEGI